MLLEVKNLNAGYGFLQILRDVSLAVDWGSTSPWWVPTGRAKARR